MHINSLSFPESIVFSIGTRRSADVSNTMFRVAAKVSCLLVPVTIEVGNGVGFGFGRWKHSASFAVFG